MAERRVKLTGIRQFIGESMKKSVNMYPQGRGRIECDMSKILELKDELLQNGQKIAMSAFMIKLIGMGIAKFPDLNSRLEGDEIVYYDHFNCGLGIDIGAGLYVLTFRDVDKKSLVELSEDFKAYLKKMQDKKLTIDDMQGATFTVTNFANAEPESFDSIITNDECTITGIGGIKKKVVVGENDQIVIRPLCTITVNMNHIITDGKDIHALLSYLAEICRNPKEYLL